MEKKISLEVMRAPLSTILEDVSKKSGVKIVLAFRTVVYSSLWSDRVENRDLNTTALVIDKPIRNVLESLASVHGLNVQIRGSAIYLGNGEGLTLQERYMAREERALVGRAHEKLQALADLTRLPFGSHPRVPETEKVDDATTWAKKRIGKWPYYLAGMWKRLPQNARHAQHDLIPEGFWVGMPDNQPQNACGRSWIDENSKELLRHQALFQIAPVTGQLRVMGLLPNLVEAEPTMDLPYQEPRPLKELAGDPFDKYLKSWEATDEALSDETLGKPMASGTASSPEKWKDGGTSLAGILFSLYKQDQISIIADAYRISTKKGVEDVRGKTPKDWLLALKRNEQCFLGYKGEIVMVRHPAFWRLQQTEPSFAGLAAIEEKAKKGPLTLEDYGQFAATSVAQAYLRFESPKYGLYNFDTAPLRMGWLPLRSIWLLPPPAPQRIMNGEVYNWTTNEIGNKASTLKMNGTVGGMDSSGITSTAMLAPLHGGLPKGFMHELYQEPWVCGTTSYITLRNYGQLIGEEGVLGFAARRIWMEGDPQSKEVSISLGFSPRDRVVFKIQTP